MTDHIQNKKHHRCPACHNMMTCAELRAAGRCLNCGSELETQKTEHDVLVPVNWQDLRTLVTYARRYTAAWDMAKKLNVFGVIALNRIVEALAKHRPTGAPAIMDEREEHAIIDAQLTARKLAVGVKVESAANANRQPHVHAVPAPGKPIRSPYYRGPFPEETK